MRHFISLLFISFLISACTSPEVIIERSFEMPFPVAYASVSDFNNTISDGEEIKLNRMISKFEEKSPVKIYVVLMDALPFIKHENTNRFFTVEEYATTLMKQWQDDAYDKEKAVLILNFIEEREMYIAVSRDLQDRISSTKSQQWIDDTFTPGYTKYGVYKGLKKGLEEIFTYLES